MGLCIYWLVCMFLFAKQCSYRAYLIGFLAVNIIRMVIAICSTFIAVFYSSMQQSENLIKPRHEMLSRWCFRNTHVLTPSGSTWIFNSGLKGRYQRSKYSCMHFEQFRIRTISFFCSVWAHIMYWSTGRL